MSFEHFVSYVGCAIAWLIVMPVFIIVGGSLLLAYAILSEAGDVLIGGADKTLDDSTAREIARRMCLGH